MAAEVARELAPRYRGALVSRIRAGWKMAALLAVLSACASSARAELADLIIEAELMPERVYVGGEARLQLRLFRAPGVTHGVLRPPALGDAAELTLLGPILTYTAERAGVLYEVLERTHVIVPRRAGRLVVPGAEFEGALRYAEVFGRVAAIKPPSAHGPQRVLEVRPVPAGAGEPWLPARRLTLEESWSRDLDALSAGTPVTRTLILRAEGIAADRLPRLEMAAHPALLMHHDQPEFATEYLAAGMTGRRVQRIMLMPVAAAEVALPALSVRWWDVGADAPRTATLAGRTLHLHAMIAPAAVPREVPASVAVPAMLRWLLASIVALVAAALWWFLRARALRAARGQVRAACRRNDARAARDALIGWGKVAALAAPGAPALPVHRIGAAWPDARARAQLAALDAALYAGGAWDGAEFWRRVRPWLRKPAARRGVPASPLPPLFRLQARGGVQPRRF